MYEVFVLMQSCEIKQETLFIVFLAEMFFTD
jgi:hypothetical protein